MRGRNEEVKMATVLSHKPNAKDTVPDLLDAIQSLADDKHVRVLVRDECEWLGTKLKEISRITRILRRQLKVLGA